MAQVKEVKGPGPRRMGGPKPKVENPGKLLKRIMDEVFKHYLPHCILVLICIIVSALANYFNPCVNGISISSYPVEYRPAAG